MRRLAEIVCAYGASSGRDLACLSLADSACRQELQDIPGAYFTGAEGNKLLFGQKAVHLAMRRRPRVVVVGHIGLVPVAWGLGMMRLIHSYIVVLHGTEAWRRLSWLDRLAARHAARIVATTGYTAQEFCRHNGVPLGRARVIPLAVPRAELEAPAAGEGAGDLNVLTVSRLFRRARYKGIHTLIDAVSKARSAGEPVNLTVVGDGDDLPHLREQARRLGLEGCVSFQGAAPDADLPRLYRECDVFAMPSKGEGFGIVFLEAMSHGKPCIGGNHGGTPEVIDHGRDGFLVEHGDVDGLAARLIQLSRNPSLRKDMGERARQKVESRFLFPRMREDWFSLLDETLLAPQATFGAANGAS